MIITPCDQLWPPERAKRLAEALFCSNEGSVLFKRTFNERESKPGYCKLCGVKLPVTWRAVKCVRPACEQHPDGEFKYAESTHEPDSLAKLEEWKKQTPEDELGMRDGYILAPVKACTGLDEQCWQDACAIVRQRKAQAERIAVVPAESASSKARKLLET